MNVYFHPLSFQANVRSKTRFNSDALSFSGILALHLTPGILIMLVFVTLASLAKGSGWPASLSLLLTWLIAGIPLELGILLYQGYKRNGRLSLEGIVLNREKLPIRQYLWLVPILLVWTAFITTVFIPVSGGLQHAWFSWWPGLLILSDFARNLAQYPRSVVWAVVILSFVLNIATPIVEELYFRGYLLPLLPGGTTWAPLISVVLFSLYHFWLPWENLTRIIALLPLAYAVQWKRNVYLSIFVHCLLNTLGSIGLLVMVLGLK